MGVLVLLCSGGRPYQMTAVHYFRHKTRKGRLLVAENLKLFIFVSNKDRNLNLMPCYAVLLILNHDSFISWCSESENILTSFLPH